VPKYVIYVSGDPASAELCGMFLAKNYPIERRDIRETIEDDRPHLKALLRMGLDTTPQLFALDAAGKMKGLGGFVQAASYLDNLPFRKLENNWAA
jgi:hypothetical protein